MTKHFSTQQLLQDYGILFDNLKTQEIIKKELAEYGYDDAEVAKGEALYNKAKQLYMLKIKEEQQQTTAYAVFTDKFEELIKVFCKDRKKAKIVYKDKLDVLTNLRIKDNIPRRMANTMDSINIFYETLNDDAALRAPLARLKFTDEVLAEHIALFQETQKAYSAYTEEKGETQDATKAKNKAIHELEEWVSEFFSIAKIALEDHPQLLESLAKFVRS